MTSLSVGKVVRQMLMDDEAVKAMVTKIFPVVTDEATLPYLFYDEEVEHTPTKSLEGVDKATVDISVMAESFEECADLCEKVRAALDYHRGEADGLKADCITLTHASKITWEGDGFKRVLTFGMRVKSL